MQKSETENHNLPFEKNDKFIEIASSLAYYLKSFSNIKRFLDYISLIFKHTFNQQLSLIIPFNKKGEIWIENIKFSGNTKNLKLDKEIKSFLKNFNFSNNPKVKEVFSFEKVLQNLQI